MTKYWHSVRLDKDKCMGCTNCIKRCPTQAIRVQGGKAKIIKERCIDCGVCINVCPYHAKKAVTDSFDILNNYKYTVALVAPAFYGQFPKVYDANIILNALIDVAGFDDVFEVAAGAELVTEKTKELFEKGKWHMPAISSACPAVVRLIASRFPNLIDNIVPLKSPMEVSAAMARQEAMEKSGLNSEDIGVFFISPCAAKVTSVNNCENVIKSDVDGILSFRDAYLKLANKIDKVNPVRNLCRAGKPGVLWATTGGEADATGIKSHVAVDGIDNVIRVLESIEDGKMSDVMFVETLACTNGCVGGPLTVENAFVANSRIKMLCENTKCDKKTKCYDNLNIMWEKPTVYTPYMTLDNDLREAMKKAKKIEELYKTMPQLDCGSCGSPSCRSLAEDIVRGFAREYDCIFKLRERVNMMTKEMIELDIGTRGSMRGTEEEDI